MQYFNNPAESKVAGAPSLMDKILSQYGQPTNFDRQIKNLSAGADMHQWTPHGHFAVGGFLASAGEGTGIAGHIPLIGGMLSHPVMAPVISAAGAGVLGTSSKALSQKMIRALTVQRVLPKGASQMLASPAGRYLTDSLNPAALAAMGGVKSMQQQPQDQEASQQ